MKKYSKRGNKKRSHLFFSCGLPDRLEGKNEGKELEGTEDRNSGNRIWELGEQGMGSTGNRGWELGGTG